MQFRFFDSHNFPAVCSPCYPRHVYTEINELFTNQNGDKNRMEKLLTAHQKAEMQYLKS